MAFPGLVQQNVAERPPHPTYNPNAKEVAQIVLWETVAAHAKEREQKIMKQAEEAIFAVGTITQVLMLFIAGVTLILQGKGEKSQQKIEYILTLVVTFVCGIGLAIFAAYKKLKSVRGSVDLLNGIMDEQHREISNVVEEHKVRHRVFLGLSSLNVFELAGEDRDQYRVFESSFGLRLSVVLDDSKPTIKNCYMYFHQMLICYGFAAFATAAGSIATASFVFFTGLNK